MGERAAEAGGGVCGQNGCDQARAGAHMLRASRMQSRRMASLPRRGPPTPGVTDNVLDRAQTPNTIRNGCTANGASVKWPKASRSTAPARAATAT